MRGVGAAFAGRPVQRRRRPSSAALIGIRCLGLGRGGHDATYYPTLFHRLYNPPVVVEERYGKGRRDSA